MTSNTTAPNPLDEALTRLINRSIDAAESVAGALARPRAMPRPFWPPRSRT